MPGKPSFRVGDAVVVKPGVLCPDKPTVSLAGWQGWVTELYPAEGTLACKWDSPTMRSIPDDYIRACEIEGSVPLMRYATVLVIGCRLPDTPWWYAKTQEFVHGPDVVCYTCCHGGGALHPPLE